MKYLFSRNALLTGIGILLFVGVAQAQQHHLINCSNKKLPNMNQGGRYDDIYFTSRDTSHITGSGNIYKTYDGASSWTLKLNDNSQYFRSLEFLDKGTIGIAGSLNGKVYRTEDGGETWKDISMMIPDTSKYPRRMCGLGHYDNTFWGVGWWGSEVACIYKSDDAGQTWTTKYLDTSLATSLVDIICLDANTCLASGGRVTNARRNSVVIKTTDGGQSWTKVFSDSILGGRIWKIQFLSSQIGFGAVESYYEVDSAHIIKTTDGGNSWKVIPVGRIPWVMNNVGTQTVGFMNEKRGWVGGYFYGYFETADGGATWQYQSDSIGNMNRIFRVDSNLVYASSWYGAAATRITWPASSPENTKRASQTSNILLPISPNPAKDRVKVIFELKNRTNVVLELVSLNGKRFQRITDGVLDPGTYTYSWDVTQLPNGEYMLWMGNDEIPLVRKFIIRR